jgi:hypothetical protein
MSKYGEVENLNVCDNTSDHMVGNVYVKFREEEEAVAAMAGLAGRFYGGAFHLCSVPTSISAGTTPVTPHLVGVAKSRHQGRAARIRRTPVSLGRFAHGSPQSAFSGVWVFHSVATPFRQLGGRRAPSPFLVLCCCVPVGSNR